MTTDKELRELVETVKPGAFIADEVCWSDGTGLAFSVQLPDEWWGVDQDDVPAEVLARASAFADLIANGLAELPRLLDENEKLREVVGTCRDQFLFYAEQHLAKGTPDGDAKARTNTEFATLCAQALQGLGE